MSTPLIAVTGSVQEMEGRPSRATVNTAYLRALESAGAIPVLLSPGMGADVVESALERCDGLVLTGGGDIDPARYGDENRHSQNIAPARDEMEFRAIQGALRRDRPVLAICRGMQLLNVALGGSLWQDLPSERRSAIDHSQAAARDAATHSIRVAPTTQLAAVLGAEPVETNSLHHQGIRRLGGPLRAVAWSDDGLIEGIELPGHRFAIGVQWHPEELAGGYEHGRKLFVAMVEACDARRPRVMGDR